MICIMKVRQVSQLPSFRTSANNDTLGEGHFDDVSAKPSGAATPVSTADGPPAKRRKGMSKKAKTLKQRLAVADGSADPSTFQ
jgi:hypothetical protein